MEKLFHVLIVLCSLEPNWIEKWETNKHSIKSCFAFNVLNSSERIMSYKTKSSSWYKMEPSRLLWILDGVLMAILYFASIVVSMDHYDEPFFYYDNSFYYVYYFVAVVFTLVVVGLLVVVSVVSALNVLSMLTNIQSGSKCNLSKQTMESDQAIVLLLLLHWMWRDLVLHHQFRLDRTSNDRLWRTKLSVHYDRTVAVPVDVGVLCHLRDQCSHPVVVGSVQGVQPTLRMAVAVVRWLRGHPLLVRLSHHHFASLFEYTQVLVRPLVDRCLPCRVLALDSQGDYFVEFYLLKCTFHQTSPTKYIWKLSFYNFMPKQ